MKESKLIEMDRKIGALTRVVQQLITETKHMRELSVGTLETLKLMPKYNEAIKKLKDQVAEIPTLLEDCKEDIYTAAKIMLELEEKYIDKMFEMGDLENLKSNDLKQFIRKRTNEKLIELGYKDKRRLFSYDEKAAGNLDWFYHLTGGHTHTDFFAIRPTDYSKANEGEDFENVW